ncbi:MAG TPA: hypothetical protein DIU35_01755 [Candidatus Latescibacteria bacterium]|nr:hypothetical protein [Candidatus Latescibacterota bacterium]|tara:strand:- start:2130 stop:4817 length:2688 start_codon:yes stop_codon:yes gene_type:complete
MDMIGIMLVALGTAIVVLLGTVRVCTASEVQHPVYPVELSSKEVVQLKRSVRTVMEMTEDDLVSLVPDKTGFLFIGCPNCDAGTQEGQLKWSVEDPDHVECKFCGMVFPNEKFPEDKVMRVVNPVGVEVEYPYWEDESGYKYLFTARGWRAARTYFSTQAQGLGTLYQVTGDTEYARRAVLILDAFARHYPGFLVSADWPHRPKGFVLEPPYPNGGGKWGRWRSDEMPTDLVLAYDAISSSDEVDRLSEETGANVGRRIEEDLFRGAVRQDEFHGPTYGNASPRIYRGLVAIGRVIGDPVLVHEGIRRSRELFRLQFYVDGFWMEGSVGYHQMTMRGMENVFEATEGYSDPPGYVDPVDGERFDNLNLKRDLGIISSASKIYEICRYPDGRAMPVHDNWARFENLMIPERSQSTLLGGVGHAWLGRGEGENQAQLHLHFSGGYGHEHADNMNMILFANGHEVLPDIGYTHTRFRSWSTGTLCHNTVVIDETRQYTRGKEGPSDGRLLAFETAWGPVQWMEASGENAYPGLAEEYRRTLILVEAGEGDVYAVDLFRVAGGSQHDYALHGNADHDGTVELDVVTTPYGDNLLPGVKVRFPQGEADPGDAEGRNPNYAYFQNVSNGTVEDGVVVSFKVNASSVGVRSHLLGQQGAEVFTGDAMSFRRANEDDALLEKFRMPMFLLRKKGYASLKSEFVGVHEPYEGVPFLQEVKRLDITEGEGLAVSVSHNGLTDYFIYRTGPEEGIVKAGNLFLDGRMGFVRERGGTVEEMAIWGGEELQFQEQRLAGSGVFEGDVVAISRSETGEVPNELVVSTSLQEGTTLAGETAIVTFGDGSTRGCRIKKSVSGSLETRLILREDPGFEVDGDGARHLFFPHRRIEGRVSCKVMTTTFRGAVD